MFSKDVIDKQQLTVSLPLRPVEDKEYQNNSIWVWGPQTIRYLGGSGD